LTGNSIYGYGSTYSPHLVDTLKSFKLVATLPVPDALDSYLNNIDVGVNHSNRTKTKRQPSGQLFATGNPTISSDLLYAPVDLGFAGSGTVPSWNVPAVIAKYFDPINYSLANNAGTISRAWDVTEKITTGFARANIDSTWATSRCAATSARSWCTPTSRRNRCTPTTAAWRTRSATARPTTTFCLA
jgi:hypothetical protein